MIDTQLINSALDKVPEAAKPNVTIFVHPSTREQFDDAINAYPLADWSVHESFASNQISDQLSILIYPPDEVHAVRPKPPSLAALEDRKRTARGTRA